MNCSIQPNVDEHELQLKLCCTAEYKVKWYSLQHLRELLIFKRVRQESIIKPGHSIPNNLGIKRNGNIYQN